MTQRTTKSYDYKSIDLTVNALLQLFMKTATQLLTPNKSNPTTIGNKSNTYSQTTRSDDIQAFAWKNLILNRNQYNKHVMENLNVLRYRYAMWLLNRTSMSMCKPDDDDSGIPIFYDGQTKFTTYIGFFSGSRTVSSDIDITLLVLRQNDKIAFQELMNIHQNTVSQNDVPQLMNFHDAFDMNVYAINFAVPYTCDPKIVFKSDVCLSLPGQFVADPVSNVTKAWSKLRVAKYYETHLLQNSELKKRLKSHLDNVTDTLQEEFTRNIQESGFYTRETDIPVLQLVDNHRDRNLCQNCYDLIALKYATQWPSCDSLYQNIVPIAALLSEDQYYTASSYRDIVLKANDMSADSLLQSAWENFGFMLRYNSGHDDDTKLAKRCKYSKRVTSALLRFYMKKNRIRDKSYVTISNIYAYASSTEQSRQTGHINNIHAQHCSDVEEIGNLLIEAQTKP